MNGADSRIWARFTVDFADNVKVAVLSDAAFRALVEMILWSRRALTDGVVPARVAEQRWGRETDSVSQSVTDSATDPLTELCSNDPDSPSLGRDDKGNYIIHDYLVYQESAADVKARIARNSANGRKGGRPRKTQSVSDSVSQSPTKSGTQDKSRAQSTEITNALTSVSSAHTATETHSKTQSVSRGTRLPDDWTPSPDLIAWTRTNAPAAATDREVERFRDYWTAQPGSKGRKTSWDATWRNWARRCQDQHSTGYRSQSQVMADIHAQARAQDAARTGDALALIERSQT